MITTHRGFDHAAAFWAFGDLDFVVTFGDLVINEGGIAFGAG